ncbi:MAG TPA: DUF1801 domain-containing protein [Gemmatimonadales bacterium]|nr:DUF1801 domain-containing protein [Gemmatimonadales bacterium]HUK73333.1 DUF1801 domain-containing protein [Streptosporangiaceae bacterium]
MKKSRSKRTASPSELIDARIEDLGDWRGELLSRLRALIRKADPDVAEEWKWETPVWSHSGLICTGETYKQVVKMTFAKGASLKDPSGLFNSSLEGNTRRAIDFHEGDRLDEGALKVLIRAAVAFNSSAALGAEHGGARSMKSKAPGEPRAGARCQVIGGTHAGKSGIIRDVNTSKTGHVTITVVQPNGQRFKTLAKNVVIRRGAAVARHGGARR